MPFNILLLPLLGGFIFVRYWNRTKYHAIRADKERILLLASTAGVISLAIAFGFKSAGAWLFPCSDFPRLPCFPTIWYRLAPFPYSAVSVFAFLLGATLWVPLNKGVFSWTRGLAKPEFWASIGPSIRRVFSGGWLEKEEIDRVIEEDGDPLDMLLRLAEKESKTISATLKSGKVYVGFVSSTNPPSSQTRSVGILPTKSGYRDPTTKQVHYEIYYSDALSRIIQDIDKKVAEFRGIRRARRRLHRDRIRKVQSFKSANNQVTQDAARTEVAKIRDQLDELLSRELELRKEISSLESLVNDFRLVFPVTEISTVSIYREEVNIEYFSHDDGIKDATKN